MIAIEKNILYIIYTFKYFSKIYSMNSFVAYLKNRDTYSINKSLLIIHEEKICNNKLSIIMKVLLFGISVI